MFVYASWDPTVADPLGALGCVLVMAYTMVALFLRPTHLHVTPSHLVVEFPLRMVEIPRDNIRSVSIESATTFSHDARCGCLMGVSPLWGGMGWMPTSHGTFEAYITSRTQAVVVVNRHGDVPLLLTPANPQALVSPRSTPRGRPELTLLDQR